MNNTDLPTTNKAASWQPFYQQLQSFYLLTKDASQAEQLTEKAEQLAKQLIVLTEDSELLLFAQLQFQPVDVHFTASIAVKQACLVLVIAQQLSWPAVLMHQLISSVFLGLAAVSTVLDAQKPEQRASSMLLRYPARYALAKLKAQLPLYARQWFQHCYDSESQKRPWRHNPYSDVLSISSQLCWLMSKAPKAGLAVALQTCYWRCQHAQERLYLAQLAATGSALWQCGSIVANEQGDSWLLLEQQAELLLVLPIEQQQLKPPIRSLTVTEQQFTLQAGSSFTHWHWLHSIAQAETSDLIQTRFPATEPQMLAPALIKQFCQQSLSQQVKALQQDPVSCQLLLEAASLQNREQQQVKEAKHALLLLGAAQLPWLLAQAQCQRFCHHQAQPHHALLHQLQQCLYVALQLQSVAMPAPQLQLLSWLLVLPLWQLPTLRLLPKYSIPAVQTFHTACSRHTWQSEQYLTRLQLLIRSYGFDQSLHKALMHFRMPQSADAQTAQIKQLSHQLYRAWQLSYLAVFEPQPANLSARAAEQLQALVERHAVYYPLQGA